MRPLRGHYFLDRRIAGEPVDRAVEIDIERDQRGQRGGFIDAATGAQGLFENGAASRISRRALRSESSSQSVDRAAHFIELPDPNRIEAGDFEAFASAFGDETLPMQQMKSVADRLTGDAKSLRQLALPDSVAWRQGMIRNPFQDSRVDLINQIRGRLKRVHDNTQFRIRNSKISERSIDVKREHKTIQICDFSPR